MKQTRLKKLKPDAKSHTNVKPTHPKLTAIKLPIFVLK